MCAAQPLRAITLVVLVLAVELCAAQAVPAVYRDEYVSIHAGVAEVGSRPIHLGDAASFIVELEFDADRVRVEALDSDFFQRAFAGQGAIRLYAQPAITRRHLDGGRAVIRAAWPFQILGCPDGAASCPGDKKYDLPIVSVSYQIVDEAGNPVNDKSVRFRPWPGSVTVSRALANPAGDDFQTHFPGGAHPEPLDIEYRNGGSIAAVIAGILLVVAGFGGALSTQKSRPHAGHSPAPANRWQHALSALESGPMPDDRWADLLRRCASWYCLDELGRNPHVPHGSEFDRFFADVVEQESIDAGRRGEYLSRFMRLAGLEEGA